MGQSASREPWAPCITSALDNDTPGGGDQVPSLSKLRWEKKQLKVAFVNDIPEWKLTTSPNKLIETDQILEWANVWSSEELGLKGTVPEFVPWREGDPEKSDIRVKFQSQGSSESLIGNIARKNLDTHTMVLNLSHDNDDYRQYLVIHEFGHALGLGHEHQMAQIAGVLNKDKVVKVFRQQWKMNKREATQKFEKDWSYYSKCAAQKEGNEFDPWSVMCYPVPAECIKKSHRNHFTEEQFKKITTHNYEKRKCLSEIDISTIKNLYSSRSLREDGDEKESKETDTDLQATSPMVAIAGESHRKEASPHPLLDPAACADMFSEPHNFSKLQQTLRQADEAWMEEFIECGGLLALFDALSIVLGLSEFELNADSLLGSLPQMECIECLKAVMNSSHGMETVINSGSDKFVNRLVLDLDSHNKVANMHLFLLLSALCKHSEEGFAATLQALDNYKQVKCTRHRYSILVFELQTSNDFPKYQAAVMAFINYTVSACDNLDERVKLRSELSALQLPDILAGLRLSDEECLSEQVELYEEGQIADQAEMTMPGGVDINNHEHLFRAVFEKVFRTPQATCLLHILQNLLLIERDLPIGDAIWNTLERFVESSVTMATPQQLDRVYTTGIERLRRALEEEEQRKTEEGEIGSVCGEEKVTLSDSQQQDKEVDATDGGDLEQAALGNDEQGQAEESSTPPPSLPPPPPPPPLPSFGKRLVSKILSIFDWARQYTPKERMKKLNWEKVPTHDAMTDGALWCEAAKESATLKVKVRGEDLETLFSQKNFAKLVAKRPQKTHLPNQRKALNINIVLDTMKRPNKEVVALIKRGDISFISLTQASILVDQTPDENDVGFLMDFADDPSKLGKTEDFLFHLVKLECYPQRLRLLKFKIIIEDILEEYQPSFKILCKAMNELVQCSALQELFKIILLIGNIINGGSKLGDAYGFKLTSLQRLSGTLANVNGPNINILHYLVTVCEEDCPNLLKLDSKLQTLDSASRISVTAIEEEVAKLRKKVNSFKQELQTGKALEKEEDEYESDEEKVYVDLPKDMLKQMKAFIPVAEDKLKAVDSGLKDVRSRAEMVAKYFCDDRKDFIDQVFVEIKTFRDEFMKIVKETLKERPIQLHLAPLKPDQEAKKKQNDQQPTHHEQPNRPGFNRAVSVVTEQETCYSAASPSPVPSAPCEMSEAVHSEPIKRSRALTYSHAKRTNQKPQTMKRGQPHSTASLDYQAVMDMNLDDATRILHKMAQAIRDDMQYD